VLYVTELTYVSNPYLKCRYPLPRSRCWPLTLYRMPRPSLRIHSMSPPISLSSSGDSRTSSLDVYLEGDEVHSPARSDSDSDSSDSEATLEDVDFYRFGHPLERMFRIETQSTDESSMFQGTVSSPTCSSVASSSSAASLPFYDLCVCALRLALDRGCS